MKSYEHDYVYEQLFTLLNYTYNGHCELNLKVVLGVVHALKITQNNRLLCRFMKLLIRRQFSYCAMVILLSFLSLLSSLSNGMHKQFA